MYLEMTDRFEVNRSFVCKIKLKNTYKSQKLPSCSKFLSYKTYPFKIAVVKLNKLIGYRIQRFLRKWNYKGLKCYKTVVPFIMTFKDV